MDIDGVWGFGMELMARAVGWTLLHFCWQGMAVAAVLWCGLRLLEGRSSRVRYGVACLALGVMVAAPVVTLARLVSEAERRAVVPAPEVAIDLSVTADGGGGATAVPLQERVAGWLNEAAPWVPAVWMVGMALFLLRLNVGLMMTRRMRFAGTFEAPAELQGTLRRVAVRLGMARVVVRLMHSTDAALVQVPMVIGWLRPVVLMPVGCLAGLSMEQVEALLAHELAHIRRHDYLVSVAQSVVEAVLFYHPAVWWVSKQVRRERECCCDELAVSVGGSALEYAKALSFLEARRSEYPEVALGANGGVLTMRIRRLLGYRESSVGSQIAAMAVLGMVTAGAVLSVSTVARAQLTSAVRRVPAAIAVRLGVRGDREVELIPAAALEGQVAPVAGAVGPMALQGVAATAGEPRGPYKTWLDQDVVWIITPAEVAAFKRLSNDEERDEFIRNFWERRNSLNGPENSFRSEHYARIAYSNEHFAAGMPGWKTDRGHVYIVYGKPESIDSHPKGGDTQKAGAAASFPYEVWHYRQIDGIGDNLDIEFVDTCRCGNYHYTVDQGGADLLETAPKHMSVVPQSAMTVPVSYQVAAIAGADASSPIRVSGGVMAASLVSRVDPVYPAEAKAARVSGVVVMRAVISKTGVVENLTVVSGPQMLQGAAVDAVKQWIYKPYLLNGQPMEVDTTVTVNFTFGGGGPVETTGEGAITGVVMDSHGAVLHDVKVTATNSATGVQVSRLSDDGGRYTFAPLPVGVYSVEAGIAGFQRLRQTNVRVDAVQTVGLDITLKVGSPYYAMNVTGSKAVLVDRQQEDETVTVVPATVKIAGRAAGPGPVGPIKVSSGVLRGGLIEQVDPVYPAQARAARVQGAVVLRAVITKTGAVGELSVLGGPQELQASAIEAVRQWRYKPYLLDGEPTEVETTITVNYSVGVGGAGQSADAGGAVQRIGNGVSPPKVIHTAEPEFTNEARKAKVGGDVMVNLVVDENGLPTKVRVVRGLGVGPDGAMDPKIEPKVAEGLNQKAVYAVNQYRFRPAMKGGVPVAVELNIEVNFQIF